MKKKLVKCGLILLYLGFGVANPLSLLAKPIPSNPLVNNQTANDAAAQLAYQLTAYQTYQADFNQMTYDQTGRVLQQSQGSIKIARPGRFRWEITGPIKQLIIANGNTLWVYDADLAQASKQTLQQQGLSPAVLLSSRVIDLTPKFDVRLVKPGLFELVPKKKSSDFPLVRLQFQNGQLMSLQMINALGQNNIFYFKNIKLNETLAPSWFQFNPPHRVDVLAR